MRLRYNKRRSRDDPTSSRILSYYEFPKRPACAPQTSAPPMASTLATCGTGKCFVIPARVGIQGFAATAGAAASFADSNPPAYDSALSFSISPIRCPEMQRHTRRPLSDFLEAGKFHPKYSPAEISALSGNLQQSRRAQRRKRSSALRFNLPVCFFRDGLRALMRRRSD